MTPFSSADRYKAFFPPLNSRLLALSDTTNSLGLVSMGTVLLRPGGGGLVEEPIQSELGPR